MELRRRRPGTEDSPEPEPGPGGWTLQVYEAAHGTCPYLHFVRSLDGYEQVVLDAAVRTILARQGHNVCSTEWGKNLRGGLYEFRVRRTLATICRETGYELPSDIDPHRKVLLRVFFAVEGARVVLLLSGYDKGADPGDRRQQKEIKRARRLLKQHQLTQRGRR